MIRNIPVTFIAFLFTLSILILGHLSFGLWTMLIFTSGFLGGFLLWLIFPRGASYESIRKIYFVTLGLFILHRIEEKTTGFFTELSKITQVPTPSILSWEIILLVLLSVGGWLLIPYLMKKGSEFGLYLTWTFFAAMGITELAHFAFPLFTNAPYGYFPGMASVILLAPVAWCGMLRLKKQSI